MVYGTLTNPCSNLFRWCDNDGASSCCTSSSSVNDYDTRTFNGDISAWDTSKVSNMTCMFAGADVFNADLSHWEIGNVESIR